MSNPFSAFCEDFYVNMRLGSQLNLPHNRETLLHLFERVQKNFPGMTRFRKTDGGEFNLEEDRSSQSYRWMSLESKRLSSGHVNPESVEESLQIHKLLLEMAPHHLGISPIEIDYLDVLFGFDLGFGGNHDEIIADALFPESPLACLTEVSGSRAVDFQPTVTVALSEDCRLQARIDVVTRTNSYQVRTGDYSDDAISVYLIVRRYWGDRPKEPMEKLFGEMTAKAEELCNSYIIPARAPADFIGHRIAVVGHALAEDAAMSDSPTNRARGDADLKMDALAKAQRLQEKVTALRDDLQKKSDNPDGHQEMQASLAAACRLVEALKAM